MTTKSILFHGCSFTFKGLFQVFLIAVAFSILILWICYPGFMSYDSIRMLEEARLSVRGGIYPAAPVYLLRFFDLAGHGQTVMLIVQNFILLLSLTLILRMLGAGIKMSISLLGTLIAAPVVIGCMLVLWKDVTLTALIMISIVTIYWVSNLGKETAYYQVAKWFSLFCLLLGTLVRLNAITATSIIVLYWLVVFYKDQSWLKKIVIFLLLVTCMVLSNKVVNGYSFPDFNKLEKNNIVYAIMSYDLVGISGWSRDSIIPFNVVGERSLPKANIKDVDVMYSSLGALVMGNNNKKNGSAVNIYPPKYNAEDIVSAWKNAIYNHPVAYMKYRWDLFSEILGLKFHKTYEPTHFNRIDGNPFEIKFHDRIVTTVVLKYIGTLSNTFLGKPWFVLLLSFFAIFFIHKDDQIKHEAKILSYYSFAAMIFYIGPFFIISGTGEVRYSFPAIILSSIPIFTWASIKFKTRRV